MAVSKIKSILPKGYGTPVDLSSYTGSSRYIIPSDGIVHSIARPSGNAYIAVENADGTLIAECNAFGSSGYITSSLPVFKGMKAYSQGVNTGEIKYIPYTY